VGNVAAANVAASVTNPDQPNITSVGLLTNLAVANSLSTSNIILTGNANVLGYSNLNTLNVASGNATSFGILTANMVTANVTSVYSNLVQAQNGLYAVSLFAGTYTDGLVLDYATGNGRISVGPADGLTFYNGGVGSSSLMSISALGTLSTSNVNVAAASNLNTLNVAIGNATNFGFLTANAVTANIANIYTTNIVGFIGSQWTTGIGNIFYVSNVGIGTGTVTANLQVQGNAVVSNAITTSNLILTGNANIIGYANIATGNISNNFVSNLNANTLTIPGALVANATNTIFSFDTFTIPYINASTLANIATLNTVTANILTLNATSANLSSANLVSANILTLNATSANILTMNATSANLLTLNATSANILTLNATSANILTLNTTTDNVTNLTVRTLANISTLNVYTSSNLASANITNLTVGTQANIVAANVQTLTVTNPIPVTSGLYMNLNATYTLNGTGNWYGNIASTWSSNLYTLFAPNPAASWTTYGSNPLVTGPTGNGGFKFSHTGPWAFTAVITADNNIKTLALSSNTADVHSNLADTDVWEYVYRTGIGQDPSIPITIPFYVSDTSKYYFLDIETDNQTDNIHRTRYTNAATEAYTGSYVILRPV
jgi:hypothetical protein